MLSAVGRVPCETDGNKMENKIQKTAKQTIDENEIPKGASPLLDRVFKYLYTRDNERSKANLRQLTSILIGRTVMSAEVLNPEVYASTKPSTEKLSRYDVRVHLENGESMDIEVQLYGEQDDYKKRLAYYGAKLYASQDLVGEKYESLKNCYQVMISSVEILPNTDWLLNFDISAQENRMVKFDGIRWIVIQLSYLEQAIQKGVGKGNKYLQNLLELCKFFKTPQKTETFKTTYEDYMQYWTEDEKKAYVKEMEERQRIDRASSKAYTEKLLREQAATIEANKATIEANKAEIADKNATIAANKATIADLLRRMNQLESLLAAKS